jgi:hypothetical protein
MLWSYTYQRWVAMSFCRTTATVCSDPTEFSNSQERASWHGRNRKSLIFFWQYQMKQSGPRWLTCGTPDVTLISLETASCVTDSYFLDSSRQIRSQPHASCGIDTHIHLIQQQLMTHTIKSLWKIRIDGINLIDVLNWIQHERCILQYVRFRRSVLHEAMLIDRH